MSDELDLARRRGYSQGYAAGKRALKAAKTREHELRERQAFLDRAFIALLPVMVIQSGWTCGEYKYDTGEKRIQLAAGLARTALSARPLA